MESQFVTLALIIVYLEMRDMVWSESSAIWLSYSLLGLDPTVDLVPALTQSLLLLKRRWGVVVHMKLSYRVALKSSGSGGHDNIIQVPLDLRRLDLNNLLLLRRVALFFSFLFFHSAGSHLVSAGPTRSKRLYSIRSSSAAAAAAMSQLYTAVESLSRRQDRQSRMKISISTAVCWYSSLVV